MPTEPRWLPLAAAIDVNRLIVERANRPHAVRDPRALDAALAHPWNLWAYFLERDIAVLAARLFAGIALTRPFAHGNRGTAFLCAATFIETNGPSFDLPDLDAAAARLSDFCEHRLSQAGLVTWFRAWIDAG